MDKKNEKINDSSEAYICGVREKLEDINKLISPYQLAYVSPTNECVPLEKNAHYMDKQTLDKLTSNIAADGFLSQLPFGMKRDDGKFLILSGNHRLKASIIAGLKYILILYIDKVSKDKQVAYQLSHNALVGKDDLQMLKDIYATMESLEAKEFSGLNGIEFIDVNKLHVPAIGDANIELTEMKFLFVESRANEVRNVICELEKQKLDDNTSIVVGSFDEFIKTLTEVKKKYGIKSNSVAFGRMVDICRQELKN